MFNKRKIRKWFKQGQLALKENDHQQAVYFFKLTIETSIKNGGIQLNECFNAFVLLGDIYSEQMCFGEADQLYRMAAGLDFSAKYVLLKQELFHDETNYETNSKKWLEKNMIDFTDIIQTKDRKNWHFLIEEGKISLQKLLPPNKIEDQMQVETDQDFVWSYEECADIPNM